MKPFLEFLAGLSVALVGAYFTARLAQRAAARERRRQLYGEAYKAALTWKELYFRVRRRRNSDDARYKLADRFHELHENLDFHRGWISTESVALWRSYCGLVDRVKGDYEPLIQEAWDKAALRPGKRMPKDELGGLPDTRAAEKRFLRDVRWHLSLVPVIPKLWIRRVNRKSRVPDVYR